jgi:hypothetical protein
MRKRKFLLLAAIVIVGELISVVYAQTSQEIRIRWNAYVGAPPQVVPGTGQYALPMCLPSLSTDKSQGCYLGNVRQNFRQIRFWLWPPMHKGKKKVGL